MEIQKRKRGRPAGSRDKKPRVFRSKTLSEPVTKNGDMLSVEAQIRALTRPVRVSVLSAISGLSESTLRKKIEQGKLRAFKRSGMVWSNRWISFCTGVAERTLRPMILTLRSSSVAR